MTDRRRFLQSLMATAGASAALAPRVARAGTQPWNVLVLCADELHPTCMSFEGHPDAYTPNLDAFAASGATLERCYVSSPVCAPTRQSWLTGLHPEEHGQLGNQFVFDPRNPTLIEAFQALGYDTACFGKLHTRSGFESDGYLGFDSILTRDSAHFNDVKMTYRDRSLGSGYTVPSDENWLNMPFSGFTGRAFADPALVPDWVLTQETQRFLGTSRTAPFFCYLSLRAPHYPFWLPVDDYGLFTPADVTLPVVSSTDLDDSPGGQRASNAYAWSSMTETDTRLVLARYQDNVTFADAMFGQVLDYLNAQGLADNTIVLFVSDHGDMMGEKGLWLKNVAFESASRKAAILRVPGVIPGSSRLSQLVSEVDLLPTLLGLAGGHSAIPTGLSGRDLSGSLMLEAHGVPRATWGRRHGSPARPHIFSSNFFSSTTLAPWMRVVQDERYKLVRYQTAAGKRTYELYDLETDPDEMSSVANDTAYSDVKQSLDAALDDHVAGLLTPEFTPQLAA